MAQARLQIASEAYLIIFKEWITVLICSIQPSKQICQLSLFFNSLFVFFFSRFLEGDTGSTLRPTMTIKSVE